MNIKTTKRVFLLLAGSYFYYFSKGNLSFALAAWLYPVCWLPLSRNAPLVWPALFIPLSSGIFSQFSLWGFTHDSTSSLLFYIPYIGGAITGLVFLADRYLHCRLSGFSSTMSFPLLYTSLEFLVNLFSPFGTTGLLGYSQADFPGFAQLASLTGIWGLSFIITWFAPVCYWILDNAGKRRQAARGIAIYLLILLPALIYGSWRNALPLKGETVRISGIHVYDRDKEGARIWEMLHQEKREAFRELSDSLLKIMIDETVTQAGTGTRIIVWSELSPVILWEDEDSVVALLQNVAKRNNVFLLASLYCYSPVVRQSENKAVMIAADGRILAEHLKFGGNFAEETVAGNGNIKTVATPYGNLAAIICWDADFPSAVRQAGKNGTDILLIPSADWKAITPAHTRVAVFRGIENGCSVVRQTQNGLSVMTDPRGKVITQLDHFSTEKWVMTGEVPVRGLFALYPYTGDLAGWLALMGTVFCMMKALRIKPIKGVKQVLER